MESSSKLNLDSSKNSKLNANNAKNWNHKLVKINQR